MFSINNISLNFTEMFKNVDTGISGTKLKKLHRTFHDNLSKFQ